MIHHEELQILLQPENLLHLLSPLYENVFEL